MRGELIVAVQKEQAMSLGVIATVTLTGMISHPQSLSRCPDPESVSRDERVAILSGSFCQEQNAYGGQKNSSA
jgi:hypothetical protein